MLNLQQVVLVLPYKCKQMKTSWLVKKKRERCILFFNGWGMDESAVRHVQSDAYDVLCIGHYDHELTFDSGQLSEYDEIIVVAWSLGVYMANLIVKHLALSINRSVAINGTLNPMHDTEGIPNTIFSKTLETWDVRNRQKFMMRMLGGRSAYYAHEHVLPNRTPEEQQSALKAILNHINSQETAASDGLAYDKSLCGTEDLIFAMANQKMHWKEKAISVDAMPHYPFIKFTRWEDIVDYGDR